VSVAARFVVVRALGTSSGEHARAQPATGVGKLDADRDTAGLLVERAYHLADRAGRDLVGKRADFDLHGLTDTHQAHVALVDGPVKPQCTQVDDFGDGVSWFCPLPTFAQRATTAPWSESSPRTTASSI
jgi:hypothetical protein